MAGGSCPQQGPWRILPHCLQSRPSSPLWDSIRSPSWDSQPLPLPCFHEATPGVSACPSAGPFKAGGGACGGLGRSPMTGAVPGQRPLDRGELMPSTASASGSAHHLPWRDPEGSQRSLSLAPCFTAADTGFQRGLGRKGGRQRFELVHQSSYYTPALDFPDLVFTQSRAGRGSWGWLTGRERAQDSAEAPTLTRGS